ncbi:site-specific integrase [Novosphingobium album (ex Hu et al. 2023)]|uniref:Tyrosine-type recombinase/integrase n=1 Tax=Novosphingobium album (ex Hu et al. 2023) TaxID=2930093 RepID=A0ABT0B0Y6_9SPHN|nr:site-specific integrase [Novosphingobium album (ex Hu et al. 2023)]MCJ2178599.1 tyrosine-type recombinase/integrase [Novosphingobium album (ex Hu et al. 2023)]
MAKLKLTSALCRIVECEPGKRKEVFRCTEQTGFGIEVRSSGEKTYWFYYTNPAGKAAQIKIGRYSDVSFDVAKKKAKELRSQTVLGGNPAAEKAERKAIPTYAILAQQHIDHAHTYQRRPENTEAIIRKYLIPRFGKLRINDVTPQAIAKHLAELRKTLAMSSVDKIRVTLNRSYVLAAKWGLPGSERNPVQAVERPRYDNKRERFLTPNEAKRLLDACAASLNPLLRPIVHLLILTGARKRELLDARWENVDVERKAWLIPDSKTGKARYVPLSQAALDEIAALPRYPDCPWLVPNPETREPFDNIKHGWNTARIAAGLPDLRIHDLRHSAASFMVNSGVDLYAVGKILGHADHQSTMRYAHLANDTLLAAVEAGAAKMQGGMV